MQSGASRYISLLPSPRLFRDLAHPSPSASGHPGPPSLLVSWASIMAVLLLLLLRQCAQAGWGSLWAVAAMPSPAGSSPLKLEEGGLGHLHSLPARGLPLPFPPRGLECPRADSGDLLRLHLGPQQCSSIPSSFLLLRLLLHSLA